MYYRKKGFTLIELLVVISVIGVLSSVVLVSLNAARVKAVNARIQQEIIQLRNLFEQNKVGDYYLDFPLLAVTTSTVLIPNIFTNQKVTSVITDITSKNAGQYGAGVAVNPDGSTINFAPVFCDPIYNPMYNVHSYASDGSKYSLNGMTIFVKVPYVCGPVSQFAIYAEKNPIRLPINPGPAGDVNPLNYAGYYCVDSSGNTKNTSSGWIPSGIVDGKCQ